MDANDQGEQHYTVQSFLVPPEELALLKHPNSSGYMAQFNDDLDIDVNILGQLSEAGITIGRQFDMPKIEFPFDNTTETSIIQKFAEKLSCSNPMEMSVFAHLFKEIEKMVEEKMSADHDSIENSVSIAKTGQKSDEELQYGSIPDTIEHELIDILSNTVIDCRQACSNMNNQRQHAKPDALYEQKTSAVPSIYEIIGRVLIEKLSCSKNNNVDDNSASVMAIGNILASPIALRAIKKRVKALTADYQQPSASNNVELLKLTINTDIYDDSQILMNLCSVLEHEEEHTFIDALRYLSDGEPKILYDIMDHVRDSSDERLLDDSAAVALLKDSIVCAVQQSTDDMINSMFMVARTHGSNIPSNSASQSAELRSSINTYLQDTMVLAKALGLMDCVECVSNVLDSECNEATLEALKSNRSFELLQRVIVMHRLSKSHTDWLKALELLRNDPYTARNDSNLCDLLRLSTTSSKMPSKRSDLTGTNTVPISLFYMNNQLLIEDFMMQKQVKTHSVFLICKDKFQAVVPRESSRDVLVGKCAYTMLDENGIRHFEPLHVYSALHVRSKPMLATRFSMYSCDFLENEDLCIDADSSTALSSPNNGAVDRTQHSTEAL